MTNINLGEMQLAQRLVTKQGEEKEADMLVENWLQCRQSNVGGGAAAHAQRQSPRFFAYRHHLGCILMASPTVARRPIQHTGMIRNVQRKSLCDVSSPVFSQEAGNLPCR